MSYKKHITILLVIFVLLGNITFTKYTVKAETDITPPEFKSITIDKKSVVAGDSIRLTINATDTGGSGMKSVTIDYSSPITDKSQYIPMSNVSENIYGGTFKLEDTHESGIWKISAIYLEDNIGNKTIIYNTNKWPYVSTAIDLSSCNFEFKNTISDTIPPEFKSITIDKKSVVAGDSIRLTINATDNGGSGMKSITVDYSSPITDKSQYIRMSNVSENIYEGALNLKDTHESGIWKVSAIYFEDNVGNKTVIYNSSKWPYVSTAIDLSSCNFELKGTVADTTPPEFKSISIDKTFVLPGESVNFSINATDSGGSGMKSITIDYSSPITDKSQYIRMSNVSENIYEGALNLKDTHESGIWKISAIYLDDNIGNRTVIYNKNKWPYVSTTIDLSNCDFELKELNNNITPLPQKYVTENQYWTSNAIEGDLYVGPQAALTINGSVTVKGNIYVLGAIKNYGNLTVTGAIYARSFIWGSSDLYNGTVLMLGGTNSIGSLTSSNTPIDIPFKIYEANNNTLVAFDGKLHVTGATLPIIDLYVDNNKINYYYNGAFSIDLTTNDKEQVDFKTVDVFGNEKILSYKILNKYYDTNNDSNLNILDLANVAKNYNTKSSNENWQQQYDYNCDEIIDIYDLTRISKKIS